MARRLVRKLALCLFIFSCTWTVLFMLLIDPDEPNSLLRSFANWFPRDSPAGPHPRVPPVLRPARGPAGLSDRIGPDRLRREFISIANSSSRPTVAFKSTQTNGTQSRRAGGTWGVSVSHSSTSNSAVVPGSDVRLVDQQRHRDPFDVWDARGVSMRFAVPECPPTKADAPELAQQSFQRLEPSRDSAFFYSAFSDHRDTFAVRVVGVAQHAPLGDLRCQLYYGSVLEAAVGAPTITLDTMQLADAFYSLVPEGLPKKYGYLELKCPGALKDRVPLAVSVVPNGGPDQKQCVRPHNLLLVQTTLPYGTRIHPNGSFAPPQSASNSRRERFAVCLPALNTNYDMAERLVEWLEFNRLLGAKHVFFYNHTVGARAAAVIESYRRGDLSRVAEESTPFNVSLLQWQLPAAVDLHYFAQTAVLNDCLLRAIRGFEYVVVADLDEFAVPHRQDLKTWHDLYERYFPRHPFAASYMFRSMFFFQSFSDDPTSARNATIRALDVMPLLKTMHDGKLWSPYARSKYIASTDLTETVATHQIRRVLPGARLARHRGEAGPVHYAETHVLEPGDGLLHHYRVPFETPPKEGARDRHVPDTYGDPLLRAVSLARQRLHSLNVLQGRF